MDGKPDDATGWGNKFKQAIAINKQLVPLKLTMLLYYGGNFELYKSACTSLKKMLTQFLLIER